MIPHPTPREGNFGVKSIKLMYLFKIVNFMTTGALDPLAHGGGS